MTTVLHLQKVAGISGSEAHLLSLLPRLRDRGWDVRMLMLHEHEPGAWDFARELRSRGVPLDAIPLRADVDPIAFDLREISRQEGVEISGLIGYPALSRGVLTIDYRDGLIDISPDFRAATRR